VRWSEQPRQGGGPSSVLVVDDEEVVCKIVTEVLRASGYRVRYVTSGAIGLERVAEEAPDLILLDLQMPDMNGPRFLEKLRKTHAELPVVIVTAYPDSELMRQAMRFAPLMVLAKPVNRELLERTVRVAIGLKVAACTPMSALEGFEPLLVAGYRVGEKRRVPNRDARPHRAVRP